jgi:hypothetical protein
MRKLNGYAEDLGELGPAALVNHAQTVELGQAWNVPHFVFKVASQLRDTKYSELLRATAIALLNCSTSRTVNPSLLRIVRIRAPAVGDIPCYFITFQNT